MASKSILSAVSVSTLGNAAPALLGFLSAPVLARAFSVGDRGEVAAATSVLVLAGSAFSFGVPEALTFAVARRKLTRRLTLNVGLLTAAFSLLVWVSLSALVPVLSAGNETISRLMQISLAALVPTLLVAATRGIATGLQRWWLVTLERTIGASARLVALVVFLSYDGLTQNLAVIIVATSGFVGGLVYIVLLVVPHPHNNVDPHASSTALAKPLTLRIFASYSSRVWIGSLTGILLSRLDQALISPIAGPEVLGIYVVAATVTDLALVLNAAISSVMFATQSSAADDVVLAVAARISTALTAIVCTVIALSAPFVVPMAFGDDYAAAVPPLWMLLLGVVLANPGSVAGSGLNARGRPGLRSMSLIAGLVVNIALLIPLAAFYGAVGAAVATLFGTLVAGWLNIVFLRRFYGVPMLQFAFLRRSDVELVVSRLSTFKLRQSRH